MSLKGDIIEDQSVKYMAALKLLTECECILYGLCGCYPHMRFTIKH